MNFIKRKHCFHFQIVGYSNIIMYNSNATSYETLSDKCPLKKLDLPPLNIYVFLRKMLNDPLGISLILPLLLRLQKSS